MLYKIPLKNFDKKRDGVDKKMDIDRYKKQILVKEFSKNGQDILLQTHVVIIGAGGIGSNSSMILTRMGVGQIELIDDDVVDVTNLHRTSIFNENDVGKPKSKTLEKKLNFILVFYYEI